MNMQLYLPISYLGDCQSPLSIISNNNQIALRLRPASLPLDLVYSYGFNPILLRFWLFWSDKNRAGTKIKYWRILTYYQMHHILVYAWRGHGGVISPAQKSCGQITGRASSVSKFFNCLYSKCPQRRTGCLLHQIIHEIFMKYHLINN